MSLKKKYRDELWKKASHAYTATQDNRIESDSLYYLGYVHALDVGFDFENHSSSSHWQMGYADGKADLEEACSSL